MLFPRESSLLRFEIDREAIGIRYCRAKEEHYATLMQSENNLLQSC